MCLTYTEEELQTLPFSPPTDEEVDEMLGGGLFDPVAINFIVYGASDGHTCATPCTMIPGGGCRSLPNEDWFLTSE